MSLNNYNSMENAIKGIFGDGIRIESSTVGYGGGINSTRVLTLSDGSYVFVKINTLANAGFFDAEEEGIGAIAGTGAIMTPKLYCKGRDPKLGTSFLMMEMIEEGRASNDIWHTMGGEFARMHMADTSEFVSGKKFGFIHDNYIGATPQRNTPKEYWTDFFRECRLEPQIRMAKKLLDPDTLKAAVRLMDRLDRIIDEPERPSLLHGDMWGGNHMIDREGRAYIYDPAVYVGSAEADIAMTEMFSPMPKAFYEGYYEVIPKSDGYEHRRDIYNLYHHLNHLNLFGGSHLADVVRIIRRYGQV